MKSLLLAAALLSFSSPEPLGRVINPKTDNPADLAPHQRMERNISLLAEVPSARLPEMPWSDRAWDHNRALMNERYTDPSFLRLASWSDRRNYADRNSVDRILDLPAGREKDLAIAALSPAEKYDLVMGTIHSGLADANRHSLDNDMGRRDRFPTWWGICEGSAAASLTGPEPVSIVKVYSEPYGVTVPFFAPDIKALVSLLWSSYNHRLVLPEIGEQCNGRSGSDSCFDVNPASFHIALVHFLGRGNGQLLLDTDATPVVWNHPIHGYRSFFFRPGADRAAANYEDALLPVDSASRRGIAPGTAFLLGVGTKLFYGENVKRHPIRGSVKRTESYMDLRYTLELDRNLNVIGGEWLTKKHPDILWTIPRGTRPTTAGDSQLGSQSWDGMSTPRGWTAAARASAGEMMPLRKVVDGLVQRSITGN